MSVDPQQAVQPEAPVLDATAAMEAALNAVTECAAKASGALSAAEAKDFAAAALQAAQTVITLDPNRLSGGDTPEGRAAAIPPQPTTKDGDRDGQVGE